MSGDIHSTKVLRVNAKLKRIIRIEDENGFAVDEGPASDDGKDFFRIGDRLKGSIKDRADDAGLAPDFAFLEVSGSGKAGQLGAGSGATGRAVVSFSRTEDKVLGISVQSIEGRAENLDVIDFCAIGSRNPLSLESLANGGRELGEVVDVFAADGGPLPGDEEEPVAAPGDVSSDGAVVRDFN